MNFINDSLAALSFALWLVCHLGAILALREMNWRPGEKGRTGSKNRVRLHVQDPDVNYARRRGVLADRELAFSQTAAVWTRIRPFLWIE